jgi:hypothetical protein
MYRFFQLNAVIDPLAGEKHTKEVINLHLSAASSFHSLMTCFIFLLASSHLSASPFCMHLLQGRKLLHLVLDALHWLHETEIRVRKAILRDG